MQRIREELFNLKVLRDAGVLALIPPMQAVRALRAFVHWGTTTAAGFAVSAARYPDEVAIIDELGSLTFLDVHRRTNALARSFFAEGIATGDNVALMCRNHRGFIEATVALSKVGANCLYLNTAFAGPQLTDVVKREKPVALVYDEEFGEILKPASKGRRCFVAWHDTDDLPHLTLDHMVAAGAIEELPRPSQDSRVVILTSGTTGTPKGAQRSQPKGLDPAVSLLSRIPLRMRDVNHIAAPLFHSWGFAHFELGLVLSQTYVLRRQFDPEGALAAIAAERATALAAVPVMLQRVMELPEKTRQKYDTSSLRVVAVSGSALPGELATNFMDAFGDVLYNLYGTTEVAWASIATPQDMRVAPGTAGRPPHGTIVRLFDEQDHEVSPGEVGRIFVGNSLLFEGYTGGGGKAMIDGLLSTGDVGRFDRDGRLFVSGRDDDMIVSGGENVFPREVEDLLARHEAVAEAAVVGIDDADYGQRLKAFVVLRRGSKLTVDQVKAHVRDNLARFKVPREVEFVKELPRNATGKVVKRDLK